MHCPNCMSDSFDGIACFQCGHGPLCGPLPDEPEGLPEKVLDNLANMTQITEEPWKELCPKCGRRMFDGWDCANLLCRHSIPQKDREMRPRTMSPAESAALHERLGIP